MTVAMSHLLDMFLVEAREYVQSLDVALGALERSPEQDEHGRAALDEVFRVTHSLKGMCGMMGYQGMAALAHAIEDSLLGVRESRERLDRPRLDALLAGLDGLEHALDEIAAARSEPALLDEQTTPEGTPTSRRPRVEPTVRVAAGRLDELMFQMQEVVVASGRLEQSVQVHGSDELRAQMAELLQHARQLQASVMNVRMTQLDAAFARLPRFVRDLSNRLARQVELTIVGSETEVDRSMIDALADPLVHLIRNAIDHGIEPPAERVAAGKPATAQLQVSARHSAGFVQIEVRDDGRGIDLDAIVERALAGGTIDDDEARRLRESGALRELLCRPGVSTATTVTEISGRGVGLDAVHTTVRELGGELEIESAHGSSTTARVRLPMTLAILPALLVRAGTEQVAIPLERVARIIRRSPGASRSVLDIDVLAVDRVPTIQLLRLDEALGGSSDGSNESRFAVLVMADDATFALGVDDVRGTRDIATRPLPAEFVQDGPPLLGVGMLPDGGLATIVDCDRLGDAAASRRVLRTPYDPAGSSSIRTWPRTRRASPPR